MVVGVGKLPGPVLLRWLGVRNRLDRCCSAGSAYGTGPGPLLLRRVVYARERMDQWQGTEPKEAARTGTCPWWTQRGARR